MVGDSSGSSSVGGISICVLDDGGLLLAASVHNPSRHNYRCCCGTNDPRFSTTLAGTDHTLLSCWILDGIGLHHRRIVDASDLRRACITDLRISRQEPSEWSVACASYTAP